MKLCGILRWLPGSTVVAAMLALAGCSPFLETDQARLCRMTLPALLDPDASVTIVRQQEDADAQGVHVDFRTRGGDGAESVHTAQCRFREPGRPLHSSDLVDVAIDGAHLSDVNRYFLVRFWLATPEARAADPAPLGDLTALPTVPRRVAYLLQQAINGLPLTAVYALLAAAYSLVYGLVGRINLAFGELAAAGGYAAALGVALVAGGPPCPPIDRRVGVCGFRRCDLGSRRQPLGVSTAAPGDRADRAGGDDRARAVPAGVSSGVAGIAARMGEPDPQRPRSPSRDPAIS